MPEGEYYKADGACNGRGRQYAQENGNEGGGE